MPTFIADCRSGSIALPANHRDVPANCEKTITGNIRLGIFNKLISSKINESIITVY